MLIYIIKLTTTDQTKKPEKLFKIIYIYIKTSFNKLLKKYILKSYISRYFYLVNWNFIFQKKKSNNNNNKRRNEEKKLIISKSAFAQAHMH